MFVGNVSFGTTREELQTLFAEVGPVVEVFLPTDRATGRPRGFAFVEFENAEDAVKATQKFDGYELGGRQLRVNEAEKRAPRPVGSRPPQRQQQNSGFDFPPDFGADRFGRPPRSKGSRRNLRKNKRSFG